MWPYAWGKREEKEVIARSFIYGENNDDKISTISNDEYVIMGLSLFPDFRPEYEIPRDFALEYFYKYNNDACSFNSFNISRFVTSTLNDSHEGKWFGEYVSKIIPNPVIQIDDFFKNMLMKYKPLVTYTTTSLVNHKYMISNYSKKGKRCIKYKGDEVLTNYDSLFSGKIKPIRGFVRYSEFEKDEFIKYIYSIIHINPRSAELLLAIAATFMKGVCMKEEAEYRFLILTTNSLDSIDIECLHKGCIKFNCNPGNPNPFYMEKQSSCDEFVSDRCIECLPN